MTGDPMLSIFRARNSRAEAAISSGIEKQGTFHFGDDAISFTEANDYMWSSAPIIAR
jgi:hypothetical protein